MKNREIEKLIKKEINNATPHRAKEICGERKINRFFTFKRLGLIGSFAVMVCMCIILPLSINKSKQSGFTLSGAGTIVLDINPSLELSYNKKGNITQIKGLNEDGKLLVANNDYTGKSYQVVIDELISDCTELGYFSTDRKNNAVLITALDELGVQYDKFNKELESKFEKSFRNNNLKGTVICDTELIGEQIQGLTVQKSSLINTIISITGESAEVYKEMSVSQLYTILEQEKGNKLNNELIEELTEILEEIETDTLKNDILNLISYLSGQNQILPEQLNQLVLNIVNNQEFKMNSEDFLDEDINEFFKRFKMENFKDEIIDNKKDHYKPNGGGQGKPPMNSSVNNPEDDDFDEDEFLSDWFNLKDSWFNDRNNEFDFFK